MSKAKTKKQARNFTLVEAREYCRLTPDCCRCEATSNMGGCIFNVRTLLNKRDLNKLLTIPKKEEKK